MRWRTVGRRGGFRGDMDETCDAFVFRKAQGFGHEAPVVARPAGEPVRSPSGGKRGVQQREAGGSGRIGLLQRRDLVGRFLNFDHGHGEQPLVELRAPLPDLFGVETKAFATALGHLCKPRHRGLLDDNEAPRLQLAVIRRARGRLQQGTQLLPCRRGRLQGLGRSRPPGQQKLEGGGVGERHEDSCDLREGWPDDRSRLSGRHRSAAPAGARGAPRPSGRQR